MFKALKVLACVGPALGVEAVQISAQPGARQQPAVAVQQERHRLGRCRALFTAKNALRAAIATFFVGGSVWLKQQVDHQRARDLEIEQEFHDSMANVMDAFDNIGNKLRDSHAKFRELDREIMDGFKGLEELLGVDFRDIGEDGDPWASLGDIESKFTEEDMKEYQDGMWENRQMLAEWQRELNIRKSEMEARQENKPSGSEYMKDGIEQFVGSVADIPGEF